ncbi:protein phosphatase 1 regulatory subunit 12B isoform X3 [Ambystoma mexicanum]|uniref:protein phosphatase 1 regulatory subunit 12B isoform X3 n=1 Tax=Ambystoma mexicanum TaxID=8296 RepID=UPI0037E94150
MSEPELGVRRAESARARRAEQLRRWRGSEAASGAPEDSGERRPRVRFEDCAVFLAACSSGDTEEVKRLLARGADVNTANVDGLSSLHQACIDENLDVVRFLVENGADVNQQDNEGWTPLHAVASCGYLNIAEYLISHGANVAPVNSEGEVPLDLAEEAAMKDLLLEQVKKQGIDLQMARKEEEQQLLQDARQWLNSRKIEDVKHKRSGATALHVAAAKGYLEAMRLLIQAGYNLNVQDVDGWTPLHAAAYWGIKDACTILAEELCNMEIRSKLGQTPFDVADESVAELLEVLQKKQNSLRSEKEVRSQLIETSLNGKLQDDFFKNKEKLLYEGDKETSKFHEQDDEKEESSCTSSEEEEEASESEAEKESERTVKVPSNNVNRGRISEQISPPTHTVIYASTAKKFVNLFNKLEEQKDESPSSWRLGLRKTGSHNALSEVTTSREALRERSTPIYRSASSPRISAFLDGKEKDKDKSYFASIAPRRLNSTGDIEEKENRESAVSLVRSGSYTRHLWREDLKGIEGSSTSSPSSYTSYLKSPSFGRSDFSPCISANRVTSPSTSSPATGLSTSLGSQWPAFPTPASANTTASIRQPGRVPPRLQADPTADKSSESTPTSTPLGVLTNRPLPNSANNAVTPANPLLTSGTETSAGEIRERRRSYLTPVRDEEAESLRKARSRQARQTRRSTQGVTLTDLQEAEKTFSRSRAERQAQEELSDKSDASTEPEKNNEKLDEPTSARETGEGSRTRWSQSQEDESASRRVRYSAEVESLTAPPASPSSSGPFPYVGLRLSRANRPQGIVSALPAASKTATNEMEKDGQTTLLEEDDKESEDRSPGKLSIRDRRRPKERRRATGISYWGEGEEPDGGEEVKETRHDRLSRLESGASNPTTSDTFGDRTASRTSAYVRRENRLASLSSRTEEEGDKDYKKLYENALSENESLKSKLREAQLELVDIKTKLEKVAQKQERSTDRSSMLEIEKREKRALERKMSEMEEEVKVKQIQALRQMNEQLLTENRALTRVVAKLSEAAETEDL